MNLPEFTVLADDKEAGSELSGLSWLNVIDLSANWTNMTLPVFVLATASQLGKVSQFVRMANKSQKLRGLFIKSDIDPLFLPQCLHRANLRVFRNTLAHSNPALPKRVIQAWHFGMQDKLIAAAEVSQGTLLIVTCAFRTLEVAFDDVRSLQTIPSEMRNSFEISSEGSYIHWPAMDVHLDVDAIRYATDEDWRLTQDALRLSEDKRIGKAIQQLRLATGLRQTDIPDLSERQVRRVESGARVTLSVLKQLSTAHGLSLQEYLRSLSGRFDQSTVN